MPRLRPCSALLLAAWLAAAGALRLQGGPEDAEGDVCVERPAPVEPGDWHRRVAVADAASAGGAEGLAADALSLESAELDGMRAAAEAVSEISRHLAREVFNTTRSYVTLTTLCKTHPFVSDAYFLNHVLTLAQSLREVNASYPLVALVPDQEDCDLLLEYSGRVLQELNLAFMRVPRRFFPAQALPTPQRWDWRFTYPKSYAWAMDGFERLIYLDTDVMVLRNSDDLFELPEPRVLRMTTNQRACQDFPFRKNSFGGASNLLVLQPSMDTFLDLLQEFRLVRQRNQWEEGLADDQSIIHKYFKAKNRLQVLPPAEMLFTECLRHFRCRLGAVRALHFGDLGTRILSQGSRGIYLNMDPAWRPVFHRWADMCRSHAVRQACNGHCKGLCLRRNKSWICDTEDC